MLINSSLIFLSNSKSSLPITYISKMYVILYVPSVFFSDLIVHVYLFDVYEGKNLPSGKKSYAVSFILQDETKTLNEKQIENIMSRLIKSFEAKIGATLR